MKKVRLKSKPVEPRVQLTDALLRRLAEKYPGVSISDLAREVRLPYALVYNIIHKRVLSISARHYRMLFHESPPRQPAARVDGARFRKMAALWLFLNSDVTKSGLFRELCGDRRVKKVDYRIFSGKIGTLDIGMETAMEEKFTECGISPSILEQWLSEFERLNQQDRADYKNLRPVLMYLHEKIGVHPTALLNQFFARYEKGELKSVSAGVFERCLGLKKRVEAALGNEDGLELEHIKEEIYGKKSGYTLYAEIRSELKFLKKYAGKSPKHYLGRSAYMYESGGCKRIPTWRARKILQDCEAFIETQRNLPLRSIPASYQRRKVGLLCAVMLSRAADLLSRDDGIVLEKKILSPVRANEDYGEYDHGYTQFDLAPNALGMKKRAFDLMVSKNCEIFRKVGKYTRRWYLSDLYLKELADNPHFTLISTKYERMARSMGGRRPADICNMY